MASRDFEFDPAKDEVNRQKHGVPLEFGLAVLEDASCLIVRSFRPVDGEDRYKAIGIVRDKLYSVIYTWRLDKMRVISVRRSNSNEETAYRDTGRSR